MAIHTKCPGCQSQFELQDQLAGQQVQCQNCQTVFEAPAPSAAPVPQPPVKQETVGAVFDQFSNEQPAQDTFGSVYDQVAGQQQPQPQPPGHVAPPPQQPGYPSYPHEKKSGGKGLIIAGGLGCGFLLLCLAGVVAWSLLGRSSPEEKLEDKLDYMAENLAEEFKKEADSQVDRMTKKYGARKVTTVTIEMPGIPSSAGGGTAYIVKKIRASHGGSPDVVCKMSGADTYEVTLAPVDNVRSFSKKLKWATIKKVDSAKQTILASATYDSNSGAGVASTTRPPTTGVRNSPADMAAQVAQRREQERIRREKEAEEERKRKEELVMRERERVEERDKREKERALADANRTADREHRPRDGESIQDWLARCFERGSFLKSDLDTLKKMNVDEEQVEQVSALLVEALPTMRSPFDKQATAEALTVWRSTGSDRALVALLQQTKPVDAKWLIPSVGKLKTEAAAEAISQFIPEFFAADVATDTLIEMGPVAEAAVLRGKMDQKNDIRSRVYRILAEIGTRTSFDALAENKRLEKDANMRRQVRETLDAINSRHPE